MLSTPCFPTVASYRDETWSFLAVGINNPNRIHRWGKRVVNLRLCPTANGSWKCVLFWRKTGDLPCYSRVRPGLTGAVSQLENGLEFFFVHQRVMTNFKYAYCLPCAGHLFIICLTNPFVLAHRGTYAQKAQRVIWFDYFLALVTSRPIWSHVTVSQCRANNPRHNRRDIWKETVSAGKISGSSLNCCTT